MENSRQCERKLGSGSRGARSRRKSSRDKMRKWKSKETRLLGLKAKMSSSNQLIMHLRSISIASQGEAPSLIRVC